MVLSIANEGDDGAVGFLTWKEAVIAAFLLALLILYLVLRDR
ncbi:MAG TPA: hypothetical protein VHI71_02220 [Actinomycetota bacterium]|nr:hypothetical protein [Actinomycetota bacterium]